MNDKTVVNDKIVVIREIGASDGVTVFHAFDLSDELHIVMSASVPAPGGEVSVVCEWHPSRPEALTADEGAAYLCAVDQFADDLARVMSGGRA